MTTIATKLKQLDERLDQINDMMRTVEQCKNNFDQIVTASGKHPNEIIADANDYLNYIDQTLGDILDQQGPIVQLENLVERCKIGIAPKIIDPYALIENSDLETIGRLCASSRYFANLCRNDPIVRQMIAQKKEASAVQIRRAKTVRFLRSISYDPQKIYLALADVNFDPEIKADLIRRGYQSYRAYRA